MSVLNTFSKTLEAKSGVPIASFTAFSASASFFSSAISSTNPSVYLKPRESDCWGKFEGRWNIVEYGWEGYRLRNRRCDLLRGLLPRQYRRVE